MRWIAALALAALTCPPAALAAQPTPQQLDLIHSAEAAVRDRLKDADSAKFRVSRVYEVPSLGVTRVCGEVNSRNGYGGYAGFAPFVYDTSGGVVISSDRDLESQILVRMVCDPAEGDAPAETVEYSAP